MKLAMIAFSRDGAALCCRLCLALSHQGDDCEGALPEKFCDPSGDPVNVRPLKVPVEEWVKERFARADGFIFIGAAGIAVRSIAPWIQDKYTDPAVVVVDDLANYAISLLSGHAGSANALAVRVAKILDARPVITTSSDIHGICAVDEWARALGLSIKDHELAKEMASLVLDGGYLGFWEDPLCAGYCGYKAAETGMPSRPDRCDEAKENDYTICVTPKREVEYTGKILRLIPRGLTVGVGCKKGVDESVITALVKKVLRQEGLDESAVCCLASVDLKNREAGLVSAAARFSVPFVTFPSSFLDALQGSFSESEFVREVTGTGNVCERAAYAAALRIEKRLGARLLTEKYSENGVTVAIAVPDYSKNT